MTWNFTIVNGPYGGVAEGPAWDGSGLLFTHIPSSRILRYDPQTRGSTLYRENSNNANGLMLDSSGTLFACEGGGRRVVRYEADGSATVLADGFEGQKLNIPNDLAIDSQGRVWFTDPFYEGAGGEWSNDRSKKTIVAAPAGGGAWAAVRAKSLKKIQQLEGKYAEKLAENGKGLKWDLDFWHRGLRDNDERTYAPAVARVKVYSYSINHS